MVPRDEVLRLVRQRPFSGFRVHRADGKVYEVQNHELALVGQRSLVIGFPIPDSPIPLFDDYEIVPYSEILRLEPLTSAPKQSAS
jgi:hypothetical protein